MNELTYISVDEALADALAHAHALRRFVSDEHSASELDLVCQLIEAVRTELSAEPEAALHDGDAVHQGGELPPMLALTGREEEVLHLMECGLRNKEIAEQLGVTERTAAFHVGNVLAKLGADGRVEAVHLARQHGLLTDAPVRAKQLLRDGRVA